MSFWQKIRNLISHKEREVERLEEEKAELSRLLDEIGELSIDYEPRFVSLKRHGLYSEDFVFFLRQWINEEIKKIADQISKIQSVIIALQVKLRSLGKNTRSYIRQLHHFLFKNLDDTHEAVIFKHNSSTL